MDDVNLLIPEEERASQDSDGALNLLNSEASNEPLLKIDTLDSDQIQLRAGSSLVTLEQLCEEIIHINSLPQMTALQAEFRSARRQISEENLEEFARCCLHFDA